MTSGLYTHLRLSNIEALLKSSALYVITHEYFLLNTKCKDSALPSCADIGSDVGTRDYDFVRSLIHNRGSSDDRHVNFAYGGPVGCASRFKN